MAIKIRSMAARTVLLAMTAVALSGGVATATEPAPDQTTIAALEKQASEYRATAEKHEAIAKQHRGGAGSAKMNHQAMVRHCQALAKSLRAAADESEALAEEYRKQLEQ